MIHDNHEGVETQTQNTESMVEGIQLNLATKLLTREVVRNLVNTELL